MRHHIQCASANHGYHGCTHHPTLKVSPDGYQWAVTQLLHDVVLQSGRIIVVGHCDQAGCTTLITQLAQKGHATMYGFREVGVKYMRAVASAKEWGGLRKELARGDRKDILAVEVARISQPLVAQRLSDQIATYADASTPVETEGGTTFIGQHVVVFVHFDTLPMMLPPLLRKEVWLTFATQNPNAPVWWHFPGCPPKHLPGRDLCGYVGRAYTPWEDPDGDLAIALRQWMDQSAGAGSAHFLTFLAELPAATPAAVVAELALLTDEARRALERRFAIERARGLAAGLGCVHLLLPKPPAQYEPYPFAQ